MNCGLNRLLFVQTRGAECSFRIADFQKSKYLIQFIFLTSYRCVRCCKCMTVHNDAQLFHAKFTQRCQKGAALKHCAPNVFYESLIDILAQFT